MREIDEGDTKFPYDMKLVPPKHLGIIVHLGTIHRKYYSLQQH